jgi:hypothetical protein
MDDDTLWAFLGKAEIVVEFALGRPERDLVRSAG